MKKKVMALVMVAALASVMAVGCGSKKDDAKTTEASTTATTEAETTEAPTEAETTEAPTEAETTEAPSESDAE